MAAPPFYSSQIPADTNPLNASEEIAVRNSAQAKNFDVGFYGDSTMFLFAYGDGGATWTQQIAPLVAADFGVPGDMTSDMLWRLDYAGELNSPPKVAVVEIGLNNIAFGDQSIAETFAGIKTVVQTMRVEAPQTKILLLGVFPSGTAMSAARRKETAVNNLLPRLADGQNIRFLNPGLGYIAPNGSIDATTDNELHPNTTGYQIIANEIMPTVVSMLDTPDTSTAAPTLVRRR